MVSALSLVSLLSAAAPVLVRGQSSMTPLVAKRFNYTSLPYKADTDNGVRGPQYGYNRCNSTTEGPTSLCQTSIANGLDDFCLWGPPEAGEEVGSTEGEMVAWCTKPGYGTRLIPAGALQGVQLLKMPDYFQIVGYIDQQQLGIPAADFGGEMDPHGADNRGNPLGGLVFSTAFGTVNGQPFRQVIQWTNFMGSNQFCLKVCNPDWENGYAQCEHIFDRIGCAYNAPNAGLKINGTFEECQAPNQPYPGVYTQDGQVRTYTQPAESLGPITSIPYTAPVPASSSCTTRQSAELYASLGAVTSAVATTSSTTVSSSASSAVVTGSVTTQAAATSRATATGQSTATATPSATTGSSNSNLTGGSQMLLPTTLLLLAATLFAACSF